jgi:hypothetical protein
MMRQVREAASTLAANNLVVAIEQNALAEQNPYVIQANSSLYNTL